MVARGESEREKERERDSNGPQQLNELACNFFLILGGPTV